MSGNSFDNIISKQNLQCPNNIFNNQSQDTVSKLEIEKVYLKPYIKFTYIIKL